MLDQVIAWGGAELVGKDVAKRYLTVANECAQAAVAGLIANP